MAAANRYMLGGIRSFGLKHMRKGGISRRIIARAVGYG
jgi:hypothetical protein